MDAGLEKLYKTLNSVLTLLCCFVCGGVRIQPVGEQENSFRIESKHYYLHRHHHLILSLSERRWDGCCGQLWITYARESGENWLCNAAVKSMLEGSLRLKLGCCKIHIRRRRGPWNRKTRNWGTTSGSRKLSTPNWETIMQPWWKQEWTFKQNCNKWGLPRRSYRKIRTSR